MTRRSPSPAYCISIHALREEGDGLASLPLLQIQTYFYPRPPRGGRPSAPTRRSSQTKISIHALREEGDGVNPYSGLAGFLFLSTPSARRATVVPRGTRARVADFYPRPPRGGRPGETLPNIQASQFLSTPSARRATHASRQPSPFFTFLSTPSARRATFR